MHTFEELLSDVEQAVVDMEREAAWDDVESAAGMYRCINILEDMLRKYRDQ